MSRSSSLLLLLILPCFALAIYANTLGNGFVYDDKDTIVNNTLINDLTNLPKLFDKKEYFARSGEASYRPVVTLTYFLDYAIYGLNPRGYHLTNILLHTANVVLLYLFLASLNKEPEEFVNRYKLRHLFVALLFVTHPALTEAVNAISYREDLLTFLFYMTTLNLYLTVSQAAQPNNRTFSTLILYLFSCLTFLLALLSKEMAATLPLIVFLYEWVYGSNKKEINFNPYNIGYVAVTAFYLYLRLYHFHNPMEGNPMGWGIADRFLTLPYLILNYLKLIIFPVSLSADYFIMPVKSLLSTSFVAPSIIMIFLLVAAFTMKKGVKGIAFGILFFLATLIPVYNIIPITNPLAERYLYLPTAGCIAIYDAFSSRLKALNLYLFIPFIAILFLYSIGAINRNKVWKDEYTLWSDAARKVPQDNRPYYNDLGNILYKQGRIEEAIKQYQMAIRLRPGFVEAYNNLGNVLAETGRFEEAVKQYQTALKLRPDIIDVHLNLANLYLTMGRFKGAIDEFKIATGLKPDDIELHNTIASAYATKNMFGEAVQEYKEVLSLNPESINTHYDLGTAYMRMGLKDKAIAEFEIILKRKPDFLPAHQAIELLKK